MSRTDMCHGRHPATHPERPRTGFACPRVVCGRAETRPNPYTAGCAARSWRARRKSPWAQAQEDSSRAATCCDARVAGQFWPRGPTDRRDPSDGCPPSDLVFIGRADTSSCRADRGAGIGGFTEHIEFLVQRQNQGHILSNTQRIRRHFDTLAFEPPDFLDQRSGIEHHAVADHREFARPHHAGRQQRQFIGDAIYNERVACIMAALETHYNVGLLREPIDNLALAFVTPLRADDHHIRHGASLSSTLTEGAVAHRPNSGRYSYFRRREAGRG